mmetsp:Transcript_108201/g.304874  ORF Transcript_108201/g.304874 Transcript_108201/m.304874 type:complete len:240 (+) Transcript_108201:439-1158(+)
MRLLSSGCGVAVPAPACTRMLGSARSSGVIALTMISQRLIFSAASPMLSADISISFPATLSMDCMHFMKSSKSILPLSSRFCICSISALSMPDNADIAASFAPSTKFPPNSRLCTRGVGRRPPCGPAAAAAARCLPPAASVVQTHATSRPKSSVLVQATTAARAASLLRPRPRGTRPPRRKWACAGGMARRCSAPLGAAAARASALAMTGGMQPPLAVTAGVSAEGCSGKGCEISGADA